MRRFPSRTATATRTWAVANDKKRGEKEKKINRMKPVKSKKKECRQSARREEHALAPHAVISCLFSHPRARVYQVIGTLWFTLQNVTEGLLDKPITLER